MSALFFSVHLAPRLRVSGVTPTLPLTISFMAKTEPLPHNIQDSRRRPVRNYVLTNNISFIRSRNIYGICFYSTPYTYGICFYSTPYTYGIYSTHYIPIVRYG